VGVALIEVAVKSIEPLLERVPRGIEFAEAPFSKHGGRVTRLLEDGRHRDGAGRQGLPERVLARSRIAPDCRVSRVLARQ